MTLVSNSRSAAGAARYVSRGGNKLDAALNAFDVAVTGRRALDAGASTGGFTDALLQRGAERVIAVDVAYGQLAWSLRRDERVRVVERTNIRTLDLATLGEDPVDLVVADLAFISLRTVRDSLISASTPDAALILLVKPQFEAPRQRVRHGGVVEDPAIWRDAVLDVTAAYRAARCVLAGVAASPLVGPAGNREFFLHLRRRGVDIGDAVIDEAIRNAP